MSEVIRHISNILFGYQKNSDSKSRRHTLLMFLYSIILLITLYLLKPVRDSLFIFEIGAEQLPWVFIATAVLVAPVSRLYSRFSQNTSIFKLVVIITLILVSNLFLIWFFIDENSVFLFYGFYIWVSIFGVLITSQFWLLANSLFDAIESRRIFSILSLGTISGAIIGGEVTNLLTSRFNATPGSLILLAATLLLLSLFVLKEIAKGSEFSPFCSDQDNPNRFPAVKEEKQFDSPLKEILKSKHLLTIAGIVGITVFVTTMVDFQFKTYAEKAFTNEQSLTAFFGSFYGKISIIAFLFQLIIGNTFVKKAGTVAAVITLPVMLTLGSVGMILLPGLMAATLVRGTDQVLKHSIDRTGKELLYLPVDLALKKKVKVFIDLFVDHGAQGLAGLTLLILFTWLKIPLSYLTFLIIGLSILWFALGIIAQRSYVGLFRKTLEQYTQVAHNSENDNPIPYRRLQSFSRKANNQELLNLFRRIEITNQEVPESFILKWIDHPNQQIREQAIRLLRIKEFDGHTPLLWQQFEQSDADTRLEIIRYVYKYHDFGDGRSEYLRAGLDHTDPRIRALSLGLIAKDGGPQEYSYINNEMIERDIRYEGEHKKELRVNLAHALGYIYNTSRYDYLIRLLNESDEEIVIRVLKSMGRTGERAFVYHFLEFLPFKKYEQTIRVALGHYGSRVYGTLMDYMLDESVGLNKRISILNIIGDHPNQQGVQILEYMLDCDIPEMRSAIIRSLKNIFDSSKGLSLNRNLINKYLEAECNRYQLIDQGLEVTLTNDVEERLVLEGAREETIQRIFMLLSLIYNPDDILRVEKTLNGGDKRLKSESIEFLDNIIDREQREMVTGVVSHYFFAGIMLTGKFFSSKQQTHLKEILNKLKLPAVQPT